MSLATAIFANTVYQDVNRHTTIVLGVSGTRKIVVEHVPMAGQLDLVRTPLDTFVEQYPTLMDYPAPKAAATYLGGGYIPVTPAAREFLINLSKGIEMPIKTVADAAATPAAPTAPTTTDTAAAPAPAPAAKKVAAKKAPAKTAAPAPAPAAKKAATKVAAPAPAPAAKKAAAKKVAEPKAPRVSAADKKAAAEAEAGKQVIVLANADKAITAAMKEMAAFVGKKEGGITRAKLLEKFSKDKHVGVTKMNISWGLKEGVFKIAK